MLNIIRLVSCLVAWIGTFIFYGSLLGSCLFNIIQVSMQCEGSKAYLHEIRLTILHINTDKIRLIVILLGYLQVRQAPTSSSLSGKVVALLTNIRLC
jgi:hypothetical protein